MINSDILLDTRQSGSGSTLEDRSRSAFNGTIGAGATWATLPSGEHVLDFDGSAAADVTFGDIGAARGIGLWVNLDDTTEVIFQELAANGVSATAGALAYANWDACYVDGAASGVISTGWHFLVLTSTTDVILSAFILGEISGANLSGKIGRLMVFIDEPGQAEILEIYAAQGHLYK